LKGEEIVYDQVVPITYYLSDEKNPGEYVTGESTVTLLAFGVAGSV